MARAWAAQCGDRAPLRRTGIHASTTACCACCAARWRRVAQGRGSASCVAAGERPSVEARRRGATSTRDVDAPRPVVGNARARSRYPVSCRVGAVACPSGSNGTADAARMRERSCMSPDVKRVWQGPRLAIVCTAILFSVDNVASTRRRSALRPCVGGRREVPARIRLNELRAVASGSARSSK